MWIQANIKNNSSAIRHEESFDTEVQSHDGEILVTFRFDRPDQEGGRLCMNNQTARWLAYALLAASEPATGLSTCSCARRTTKSLAVDLFSRPATPNQSIMRCSEPLSLGSLVSLPAHIMNADASGADEAPRPIAGDKGQREGSGRGSGREFRISPCGMDG